MTMQSIRRLCPCGQNGMSLVELMVAMVISLVLLGGIYKVFVSSTTTNQVQQSYARLQENARFAADFLSRDIRNAGYRGCISNEPPVVTLNNASSFDYRFGTGIEGFDGSSGGGWTPSLNGASVDNADNVQGSDILTLRTVDPSSSTALTANMPSSSSSLKTPPSTNPSLYSDGDILLISDCSASAVFQVTQYTNSSGELQHNPGGSVAPGNSKADLGRAFRTGAEVYRVSSISYFVRNRTIHNSLGKLVTEPALYRQVDKNAAIEMLDGVESMQILYGIDTNGDRLVDQYVSASSGVNWDQVVSVRIGLLLRSVDNLPHGDIDNKTYDVNGTNIQAPGDQRLRQVATVTIALRNRLP